MGSDWKSAASKKIKETGERASSLASELRKKYEKLEIKEAVHNTTGDVKHFLDEHGVSGAASKVANTVDEHLNTLSGQKILHLVEERLSLQAGYNDILANQLDDALTRIKTLEAEIANLKKVA